MFYTPSSAEVMYYLSFFSLLGSTALTLATGEMSPAALHSLDNPHVVPTIVAFSLMGYLSVAFVLLLIKHFDATVSEVVKSARKVRRTQ
jgi:adenosine 3'-phospho 5'-phosphosulfate transporter B3